MQESSVVDLMRDGLAAYLDVLFPGEGVRVFQAQPPLGGRMCNLRQPHSPWRETGCSGLHTPVHPAEISACRAAASFREAVSSQKRGGDIDYVEVINCNPSTTLLYPRPLQKLVPAIGDDEIASDDETASTDCGSEATSSCDLELSRRGSSDSLAVRSSRSSSTSSAS